MHFVIIFYYDLSYLVEVRKAGFYNNYSEKFYRILAIKTNTVNGQLSNNNTDLLLVVAFEIVGGFDSRSVSPKNRKFLAG